MTWSAAWTLARRDLSARFRGLRLLLVCLFLGTGALAAIGSLTGAIERELASQGRVILGGDLEVEVWQRDLSPREKAALAEYGRLSGGTRMQAMATAGDSAAPIELKAVDESWPLYGTLTLADGRTAKAPPPGSAWVAQGALDRLGIAPGERFRVGTAELVAAGVIADEPDRLSEGFQLGPTVIVEEGLPRRAGMLAPGSMYQSKYRVAFAGGAAPEDVRDALEARFPDAGFDYRTRDRASPGADRFVGRMGEFLTLVGLAALVIAGIGIGGGVSAYLEARRRSIATLKVLGAASGDIAKVYALEIGAAALVGSIAGIAAGVLVTPLLARALDGLLPVSTGFVFAPQALLLALAYGLAVALVFAAPPLLRARTVPAMALMRARVEAPRPRSFLSQPRPREGGGPEVARAAPGTLGPRLRGGAERVGADRASFNQGQASLLWVGGGLAVIVGLALTTSRQPWLSAGFLAGAAAVLGLLALLGLGIRRLAARLPRLADPLMRAALANLHRPGAATATLVTALGFGLAAFVLLAAVQTSIDGTIARRVPAEAPDYFVLDLPKDRVAAFEELVERNAPGAQVRTVPALRGSILAYGPAGAMTRVAELDDIPDDAWALRGERGLTYADAVPPGNTVTEGEWWGADWRGEPLVSVDEELAGAIGLELGDRLTIGVLGVERTARVASLRRIDWESMGFNYVLVFSPDMLADVPHNLAATIELPESPSPAGEGQGVGDVSEWGATPATGPTPTPPLKGRGLLLRDLVRSFPSSSVIETGPVLEQARTILQQVGMATLAAASVAVLAGVAVLLGAIAAAHAQRTYDTVVLRVLGASRRQVLTMALAEYGALALVLAVVALALGSATAWLVVVELFEFEWLPDWPTVLAVLGGGLALVLAFALAGALPLLRARPAQALRAL